MHRQKPNVKTLRLLVQNPQNWHRLCRLCAKDDPTNMQIFTKNDTQEWNNIISTTIGKFFWVNIKINDELSSMLCRQCYKLINDLINFSTRVNKVQKFFNVLQTTNATDIDAIRVKCGLDDNQNSVHAFNNVEVKENVDNSFDDDNADIDLKDDEEDDDDSTNNLFIAVSEEAIEAEAQNLMDEAELIAEIEEEVLLETHSSDFVDFKNDDDPVKSGDNVTEQLKSNEHTSDELDQGDDNDTVAYINVLEAEIDELDESYADQLGSSDSDFDEKLVSTTTETIAAKKKYMYANPPNEEPRYNCPKCKRSYKKPRAYKKHMQKEHKMMPTDMPELTCKHCDRVFHTENQLNIHERTHMSVEQKACYECPTCNKRMTTASALKMHIDTQHRSLRQFICDICGRALKTLGALNEHKYVHTDECPYECPICHSRFKNKSRLKAHSDIHSIDSYECNICGLKLNTKRTLSMHRLVHTEEKQFKCNVCDAAFKRSKALKTHLILHTGIRPYSCNFCDRTFSNGSNFRMHKRKSHPKELEREEAEGKKRRTQMPLLEELKAATKEIEVPRKIIKGNGGLPDKMREILIAAEKRENALKSDSDIKVETCIEVVTDNFCGLDNNDLSVDAEHENYLYEVVDM